MSIGEVLAAARSQAGLTITQVSQRTRIRETIIGGIERDDFSACGADFYARGHIRAIARAVGVDGEPLVAEYDSSHGPAAGQHRGRHPRATRTPAAPAAPPAALERCAAGRARGGHWRGHLSPGGVWPHWRRPGCRPHAGGQRA